jgi:hypothetical protein
VSRSWAPCNQSSSCALRIPPVRNHRQIAETIVRVQTYSMSFIQLFQRSCVVLVSCQPRPWVLSEIRTYQESQRNVPAVDYPGPVLQYVLSWISISSSCISMALRILLSPTLHWRQHHHHHYNHSLCTSQDTPRSVVLPTFVYVLHYTRSGRTDMSEGAANGDASEHAARFRG